jgi:impB/mucB/samB family C-terminal domain
MSPERVYVHVLLPRFREACSGRSVEELVAFTRSLEATLAHFACPWRTPAAGEAVFEGEPPWSSSTKPSTPLDWGSMLRDAIASELRLDSSVGIAATELAARLAARFAGPRGVLLWMAGREKDLIDGVPVEELDELRPEQVARLRSQGVTTLDALARLEPAEARTLIGVEGEKLVELVSVPLDPHRGRQSASPCTILAKRLSRQLERRGARTRGLELAVGYADGVTRERHCQMPRATSDSSDLAEAAFRLYRLLPRSEAAVVGLSLSAIGLDSPDPEVQLDLFPPSRAREVRVALGRADDAELDVDTAGR